MASAVRTLTVTREVYDGIVEQATQGRPEEVCGVLAGEHGERASRAVAARAVENVAPAPRTTYQLDPREQLETMDELESEGADVVGFYHSHPTGPPRPSPTDAQGAAWTNYSYVIVVLDGEYPYVGSWRWLGDGFEREQLVLV